MSISGGQKHLSRFSLATKGRAACISIGLLVSSSAAFSKPPLEATPTESGPQAPVQKTGNSPDKESRSEWLAEVTAPVAIATPLPILEDLSEKVELVLELRIDRQGQVVTAKVLSGAEFAASAAVEASKRWSFRPATYQGKPISAKIQFLITFPASKRQRQSDKVPLLKKEVVIMTEQAPTPSPAAVQPIAEVIVQGKLQDPSAKTVTRSETRNLAGAFDDPLRAIEILPGVTPIASGLPLFFVRGAPPGNVGTFIDGIKVPLLYHAFLGPSVLHPAFLESVSLHAGPTPIRYGRFAGAIIEADLSEPQKQVRGEASVRLLDAGAFAEAPIQSGKGYILAGGRYSYTALILSLVQPEQSLEYWDYQVLAGYHITPKDEFSVFTFGAYDYAGDTQGVVGGTQFHRVDLRYDHSFQARTHGRIAFTWGRDATRSQEGLISDRSLAARASLRHESKYAVFRGGMDISVDRYALDVDAAILEPEIYKELFPSRTDTSGGTYFDVVLLPRGPIQITPGIRADYYSSLGQSRASVDPRINVEIKLYPNLKAIHEVAVSHQTPNFVPAIPGAQVAGLEGGLQRSLQLASTFEAKLPFSLIGSLTGFINGTENLSDPIGMTQSLAIDETSRSERTLGRSFGIETYLKRALTRRIGGLLSYTFSRTFRSSKSINTPPGYERPHVLNAAGTYELGHHWRISSKLAFASGILGRRTTPEGPVFDQSRSFPYFRIDAKLSKRWVIDENFNWGLHLEVLNITHSTQVSSRTCDRAGCENSGTAPITIPSLGIDATWQ